MVLVRDIEKGEFIGGENKLVPYKKAICFNDRKQAINQLREWGGFEKERFEFINL